MNFIRGIPCCEKLTEKDLCSKDVVVRVYAGALTTYFNFAPADLNVESIESNLLLPRTIAFSGSPVLLLKHINAVLAGANGKQLRLWDLVTPEKGVTLGAINAMDKLHRKQEALRVKAEDALAEKINMLKGRKNENEQKIEEVRENIDALDRAYKKIGGENGTKESLVQQLEILEAKIGACEKEKIDIRSGKQQILSALEKSKVDLAIAQTNVSCVNNLILDKNQLGQLEVSIEEVKREIHEAEAEITSISLQLCKLKELKRDLIKRVDKTSFREHQAKSEAQDDCEEVVKGRAEVLMVVDKYKTFEEEFTSICNEFETHLELCNFVSGLVQNTLSQD